MNIDKKAVGAVAVILFIGVSVGFLGGFAYRDSLMQDYVNIWFQEFYEIPDGAEPVAVYAEIEVWYGRGTIERLDTFTWRWGDGGYGPEEKIPRGTVLQVSILFLIDATWDWLRSDIVGQYQENIESQYITGTRAEFFCNCSYGIYGYIVNDY